MNLLMISTDRGLLDPTSRVSERFRLYASLFDRLDVIVFAVGQFEQVTLAPQVTIYPTNSSSKLRYFADAVRISRSLTPSVVSGQDPFETGVTAYRISRIHSAAFHLQVHTDVFSDAFAMHSVLNRIRVYVARWLLPKAQGIRVVSKRIALSLKAQISRLRVEPIVLPIAVDVPGNSVVMQFPFAQTVLMVSRLEPEKQVAQAIEGFLLAAKDRPDIGLVIAGDGSQRYLLEQLVAARGATSSVQFVGALPDVFGAYAGADVFLQVSQYEGYGMTLIEAAVSGLPIVTTDVGIVGEVLVDGGSCLVTSGTPQDVAIKLGIVLDEAPFRETLGGRAREAALAHVQRPEVYAEAFKQTFTV